MSYSSRLLASLVLASLVSCGPFLTAQDSASNWNQFRGPDGNGVSELANPPINWSNDSNNLKWKVEIPGDANSSPIVWGNKIIVMTAVDTEKTSDGKPIAATPAEPQAREERPEGGRQGGRGRPGGRSRGGMRGAAPTSVYEFWVMCLNREDGSVAWKTKLAEAVPHEGTHPTNTYCSGSPITDGKHIYASFGSFGLFCLDMDGKGVWERDLGKLNMRMSFGEGISPALYEDKLVVVTDQEGQSQIECMNALTGKTIWKEERTEGSGWATPRVVKHKDRVQVIVNASKVVSYDLADGSVIWECGGQTINPIPTPLLIDDLVICMTGFRSSACYAIPLDSKGDVTDTQQIAWSSRDVGPYVPTGVIYKGTLYATKGSSPVILALNAKTGETIIEASRLDGIKTVYSSMVAAADHIFVTGRSGKTLVLKHGDTLDVVAENELGEEVDATPALVDNQILIRGDKHLFCFENK